MIEQIRSPTQPPDRQVEFDTEMIQIPTTQVAHLRMLQMLPHSFIRVEFGCISGESLQMNVLRPAANEKSLHFLRTVNHRTIPDHQQFAPEIPIQMSQKGDALNSAQRFSTLQGCQLPSRGHSTHHRQMLTIKQCRQNRCLTNRGISSDHSSKQIKRRFVYTDNDAPLTPSFFFRLGQTSVRQWAMCCSSRLWSRVAGFCGVESSCFSKRERWALWYETPNSHSITLAMRAHVQTSPRKPYAGAPCARKSGKRASCCFDNLGMAPKWGRASKPASPSSRTLCIHLLTDLSETLRRSAISSRVQPSRLSSSARYRRTCFQSGVRRCLLPILALYHAT